MAALTEGFGENETTDNTLPEIFQGLTGTSSHRREGQVTLSFSNQRMGPPQFLSVVVRLCEDRRMPVRQKPLPLLASASVVPIPSRITPVGASIARAAVVGATPRNPTIISPASNSA
jgi:hypothetical protein